MSDNIIMKKAVIFSILGVIILIAALVGVKGLQINTMIQAAENFAPPPSPVTAVEVSAQSWSSELHTVGAFAAVEGVTVSADLSGRVAEISFESGAYVEAGEVLLQQDVSTEQAQLREAEASVELARLELDRSRRLLNTNAGSQATFDSNNATLQQAIARADSIRATIRRKTIQAPFSGRLGIRQVNLGQNLSEGQAIVSLQNLDPIYINFVLPQRHFAELQIGMQVRVLTDAVSDGNGAQPLYGEITTINPEVDASTRNLAVQATLPNPDGNVLPGMSASVSVILPDPETVLAIPVTAVLNASYGDSVFIIEDNNGAQTLRQQFVRLGRAVGDYVAIDSGLESGQQVVTTGVFKLFNGQPVVIDNNLQPDFQLQPEPENR